MLGLTFLSFVYITTYFSSGLRVEPNLSYRLFLFPSSGDHTISTGGVYFAYDSQLSKCIDSKFGTNAYITYGTLSFQIEEFLNSRRIGYPLSSFKMNKIDDNCAPLVDDARLGNIGLAYGDIVMYHAFFATDTNNIPTYTEMAEELKRMLRDRHPTRKDCNRTIMVTIGLRCMEKKKDGSKSAGYTTKQKKNFEKAFEKKAKIDEVHQFARRQFKISSGRVTFMARSRSNNKIADDTLTIDRG